MSISKRKDLEGGLLLPPMEKQHQPRVSLNDSLYFTTSAYDIATMGCTNSLYCIKTVQVWQVQAV
jgi:hypothetical protein